MAGDVRGGRRAGPVSVVEPRSASPAKPAATATIGPAGVRGADPGDHLITVILDMATSPDQKHRDTGLVGEAARSSLGACMPAVARERFDVREISGGRRAAATGSARVIGMEASVISPGRPPAEAVERLRDALTEGGYAVAIRERRECTEPRCASQATIGWNQPEHIPPGWFSAAVCGRHDYRSCVRCMSIYLLTSTNSAGQAPSVHCEVCGAVLVEWGSSKIWDAQLVSRGTPVS